MKKISYKLNVIRRWLYHNSRSALCIVLILSLHTDIFAQSGVPWRSGGSRNTNLQSSTYEWATFRGKACNFQVVYSNRSSGWASFVSSHGTAGQIANFTDPSIEVMIQTSPFPEGNTYASLVAGAYDSYWQQIGTLIKNREDSGKPTIISIAWEMNGTYMFWGGGSGTGKYSSPAQYISGYQRIVNQLRVTHPQVRTAWIINAHATPAAVGTTNAWDLYPGNAHVTYVGTDNYDHYPPSFTKTSFDNTANANGGLYWLANLAAQNGKQVIVGEWGVNSNPGDVSAGNGGGDNANFIQWMYETFQSWYSSGRIYAEYYFADPCGGGNVDSDLIGCNSNSRSRYITYWSSGSSDTQAPTVPTGLASSNIVQTSFTLSWTASTDNVGVTGYEVFMNGTSIGTPSTTSFGVTGLSCNSAYSMTVRARDAAGNWSAQSSPLNVTTSACTGGGTPDDEFNTSTLDAKWSWTRQNAANWSLTSSSGNMRIIIEPGELNHNPADNKNMLLQTAPSGDWSIISKVNCKPNANWKQAGVIVYQDDNNYFKMVRLYNNANQFQFGKEVAGTATSGLASDGIASTISYVKITKIGANYSGYYSADGNTWTQVWTTQTLSLTNIKIGIIAFNGAASGTAQNADFDFFHFISEGAPDTQAPTVPTGLASSSITTTSFTLSWTASTDNVGVTGYEVFRNGTSIGTPTATSMSVTGLTCATTYSMTVRARDAAGNWSAQSTALNVTTSSCTDTQAPSVPTGLASSSVAQTSFTLSWAASTDNVAVTGYEVFRNGTSIGTPATTSFNVTGLACNTTYSMTVRARDAAGNWSAQSTALNVTTSACSSSNIALNKAATASSIQGTGYEASRAFDGNTTTTRWSANFTGDPQWIYVNLGSTHTIDRVVLRWETAYATAYQIQVSPNASTWTTVFSTTTGNGGVDDITFTAVSTQYVRMYGTARAFSQYSYSLWEFEVYGFVGGAGGGRMATRPSEETAFDEGSLNFVTYPNPTNGLLHVTLPDDFKGEAELTILNSDGHSILNKEVKERSHTLDITNASSGMYVIKAFNGRRIVTQKFIKK